MTKESAKHLRKQGEQKTKRRELETQLEKLEAENAALHNRLDEADINLRSLRDSLADVMQKSDRKSNEIAKLEDKCMLLEVKAARSGTLSTALAVVAIVLAVALALKL